MNKTLVVASRNAHKVSELEALLAPWTLQPLPDHVESPEEDGETFEANALIKARHAAEILGVAVIADDSGICAEALGGAPGVRSARYAGENASDGENLQKLRANAPIGSGLQYICVLAYVNPISGQEQTFSGTCSGTLAEQPEGTNGFGYDPIFVVDGQKGRTMAQLRPEEKQSISHRNEAAKRLREWLNSNSESA